MEIILSQTSSKPIYEQIVFQIKAMIMNGQLKPNDSLPSMRKLAKDLHVSIITTQRAYDELESEGYIKTIPKKGSFVVPRNLELMREEKLKEIQSLIEEIYDIAKISHISNDEIEELFRIIFEEDF